MKTITYLLYALLLILGTHTHAMAMIRNPKAASELFQAILQNNRENIRKILATGQLDVNYLLYPNKTTALHVAAKSGKVDAIKALLESGADVNLKSGLNQTPLHTAVVGLRLPAVKALLEAPDIDSTAQDNWGQTALDLAKAIPVDSEETKELKQGIINLLTFPYSTLKKLSLEYIRKNRDKFTQDQIKQLPLELQEALQEE